MGTIEFGFWVFGLYLWWNATIISSNLKSEMKKDYFYWSVVLIELYATIHSFMYIPKVLGILGIFAYVWYWGGFEKQDNGEHAHLTILENILEE